MSKINHQTRAFGSPSRYIQGRYEINNLKEYTDAYGQHVLILVDTFFLKNIAKNLILCILMVLLKLL